MKKLILIPILFLTTFLFAQQKCLVKNNQIITVGELPNNFDSKIGNVAFGYKTLSDSVLYADGWRNIVIPSYNTSIQYLGLLQYNPQLDVCTYSVLNKTNEQIINELNSLAEFKDNNINGVNKLLRVLLTDKLDSLSEDNLQIAANIYSLWRVGYEYEKNDVVSYNNKLYKVIQPHTSQLDWKPDVSASLFTAYKAPGSITPFVQPTGAHDAYKKGDKVTFNGSTYESLIDNNVWSPTSYPTGWKKL